MRRQASAADAEQVEAHIQAGCRACQSEQELAQRIVTTVAHRQLIHAPRWLVRQAVRLFADRVGEPRPRLMNRLLASLVLDRMMLQPALGLRHRGPQVRHLVYQAGHYRIDISICRKPHTTAVDILGESLDEAQNPIAGAEVQLFKKRQVVSTTQVNPFGAFIFADIPEGIYSLKIRTDEEIEIGELEAIVQSPAGPLVN